jgi:hypothetical protein
VVGIGDEVLARRFVVGDDEGVSDALKRLWIQGELHFHAEGRIIPTSARLARFTHVKEYSLYVGINSFLSLLRYELCIISLPQLFSSFERVVVLLRISSIPSVNVLIALPITTPASSLSPLRSPRFRQPPGFASTSLSHQPRVVASHDGQIYETHP